ncbi:MAG TPA: hypothetical protein VIO60_08835 [Rectinemataceae bacterium]
MNQEQVYELLCSVEYPPKPFSLIFSGKSSDTVNGLYKPGSAEIIIHNRNFDSDDQLIYTALHEYAHHLLHCRRGGISSGRPHTQEFWGIFHGLVQKAEATGLYKNVFESEEEFAELTKTIREHCIRANGEILIEFGRLLAQAAELCKKHKARFEDYVERVLGLPKSTASAAVKAQAMDLDPRLGWDGLKYIASIRDPEERGAAIIALAEGASPSSVKGRIKAAASPESPEARLLEEKARIERAMENLSRRLEEIERKLSEY